MNGSNRQVLFLENQSTNRKHIILLELTSQSDRVGKTWRSILLVAPMWWHNLKFLSLKNITINGFIWNVWNIGKKSSLRRIKKLYRLHACLFIGGPAAGPILFYFLKKIYLLVWLKIYFMCPLNIIQILIKLGPFRFQSVPKFF